MVQILKQMEVGEASGLHSLVAVLDLAGPAVLEVSGFTGFVSPLEFG